MRGLLLLVVVLGAATAFGLWRRHTDGRMQHVAHAADAGDQPATASDPAPRASAPASAESPSAGTLSAEDVSEPLIVDGRQIEVADHTVVPAADRLAAADLGESLGERATLVQFSSAFCQPCRATRVVLGDVAAMVPGVAHVEIDAESHLDLVRRLDVTRTPTVLVLDATGRIRKRATGAPRKPDVIAALGELV